MYDESLSCSTMPDGVAMDNADIKSKFLVIGLHPMIDGFNRHLELANTAARDRLRQIKKIDQLLDATVAGLVPEPEKEAGVQSEQPKPMTLMEKLGVMASSIQTQAKLLETMHEKLLKLELRLDRFFNYNPESNASK
jgi:hypothetical protein